METQLALEQEAETLLAQFEIVVAKLKLFVKKVMKDADFTPDHFTLVSTNLERPTQAYISIFQAFFAEHPKAIENRDVNYVRALLPPEFQQYKLSEENRKKGVDYIEAIELLLEEYNGK